MAEDGEAASRGGGRVAVIGAGMIGASVALACAASGFDVTLIDRPGKDWGAVHESLRLARRRARLRGLCGPELEAATIVTSEEIAAVAGAGVIVENVTESLDAKQAVYASLGRLAPEAALIAANTSAIPITRLGAMTPIPERVVGVHFMNPLDRIDLVEIVPGEATSAATLAAAQRFLARLGKSGVMVRDMPGFVINRVLMVMISQAAGLLEDGVATAFEVDQLFRGCLGHAMGPLRTADLIGLDTVVDTLHVLRDAYGGAIYEPAPRLLEMVTAGRLGLKTRRGFYAYAAEA